MEKSNRSTEYIRLYPDYENSKGAIILIPNRDNVLYTRTDKKSQKAIMDPSTVRILFVNGRLNILYMVEGSEIVTNPFQMSYNPDTGISYLYAWVYDADTTTCNVKTYRVLPSEDCDPDVGEK